MSVEEPEAAADPPEWTVEYSGQSVVSPELSAFMNDLVAVCEKHGVGFLLSEVYEGRDEIRLVPFEEADFEFLLRELGDSRGNGVPWLDRALDECVKLYKAHQNALARVAERRRRYEEEVRRNMSLEREERMKTEGVFLRDGKYKLVKVEDGDAS